MTLSGEKVREVPFEAYVHLSHYVAQTTVQIMLTSFYSRRRILLRVESVTKLTLAYSDLLTCCQIVYRMKFCWHVLINAWSKLPCRYILTL